MAEEQPRKVARLDLTGFAPKSSTTLIDVAQDRAAVEEGKRLGFTGRAPVEKVDGRKIQMNMRVSLEVQNDFKRLVTEFEDADDCLANLIKVYRQNQE
jgi:hypothetical protein